MYVKYASKNISLSSAQERPSRPLMEKPTSSIFLNFGLEYLKIRKLNIRFEQNRLLVYTPTPLEH